jgi:mono/diheme cytochrome c family protein
MKIRRLAAVAILAGTIAGVNVLAQVQTQPYSGHADYQAYCSSCHGTEARGDGMIAKSLKQRPSDLTRLAGRNNGVFPEKKVFEAIDGRKIGAHGNPDMPAWADVFAKATESAGAENAAARIDVLVQYLQTLQVK